MGFDEMRYFGGISCPLPIVVALWFQRFFVWFQEVDQKIFVDGQTEQSKGVPLRFKFLY